MNGKSISTGILSTAIKEPELEQAVITTSPDVHPDRVAKIEKLIQKDGIENVKAPAPKTLKELVAESRAKAVHDRDRTLRISSLAVERRSAEGLPQYARCLR